MGDRTRIEWTDATWNPVRGCTHASPGCEHCYAERIAHRFGWEWTPRERPDQLDVPLHWRRPRRIFVASMGDLFHGDISEGFIRSVFDVMYQCPQHTFQVLTKRPSYALGLYQRGDINFPKHIWFGVTVEDQETAADRIPALLRMGASTLFISHEPLLGPISFPWLVPSGIQWVIVGGETGASARPIRETWVRSIADECERKGVPLFFKGWGGNGRDCSGQRLTGNLYDFDAYTGMPGVGTWLRAECPGKDIAARLLENRIARAKTE